MPAYKTLTEIIKDNVKKYAEKPAFKIKQDGKFVPITYQEFYQKIKCLGTGLLDIGLKELDHVGLISENRLEWIISDIAMIHLRIVDVPCSENSSPKDIYFKLNHSDSSAVFLEGEKQLTNFLQSPHPLPNIKNIILIDKINIFADPGDAPEWTIPLPFKDGKEINKKFKKAINNALGHENVIIFLSPAAKEFLAEYLENHHNEFSELTSDDVPVEFSKESLLLRCCTIDQEFYQHNSFQVYSYQNIAERGQKLVEKGDNRFEEIAAKVQEDDLVTIIYTSGTTAAPKGVMLVHANFVHNVRVMPPVQHINENDRFLFLPSWHIFERTAEYLSCGGFYRLQ